MNSYGFPNLLQYTRLNGAVANLKMQSEQARIEVVTGRKADLKIALGSDIGNVQLMQKAIDDLAGFRQSATNGLGRAAVTQLSLGRAAEEAATLGADLLSALGVEDESGVTLAGVRAKLDLESAIAGFNERYEGRALFSGDAVDQTPLADTETLLTDIRGIYAGAADATQFEIDLDFYFNDPAGGFATGIYQGGAGDAPSVEISDGDLVAYSAKADEPAVRDLFRSLATIVVAAEVSPSPDRTQILSNAGEGIIEAGIGLTEIRSRVGAAEGRMQAALDRLNAEEPILTAAFNEKTSVDSFETASRLQQLEAQLQTSFVLTARISQLSLANFI